MLIKFAVIGGVLGMVIGLCKALRDRHDLMVTIMSMMWFAIPFALIGVLAYFFNGLLH